MGIGIVVSTLLEVQIILSNISDLKNYHIQRKNFYTGFLHDIPVVVSITGIGKVNAAHSVTLMLERFKVHIVYILGVGGAYPTTGLRIGEVVIANREIYGDEGLLLEKSFHTLDELGLPLVEHDNAVSFNEFPMFIPPFLSGMLREGTFITVSTCSGSKSKGLYYEQKFNALCENMEGAAIAHICCFKNVPTIEIRGISNIIEDRDVKRLDLVNIAKAAKEVQQFFVKMKRLVW
ncbi:MAG: futalosine hydrolase [Thermodesulfovibrionales bacterium]|nr:futalosine hydrolase [Thermodesulfovibrionales bacterium]